MNFWREIFTKTTLELHQNSQKLSFKRKKLMINTQSVNYVYFFIKCGLRWSENSVRLKILIGIGFQMGQIL